MKILYTWTGYRELSEAAREHPEYKGVIESRIKYLTEHDYPDEKGWVRSAIKKTKCDKIIILDDYRDEQALEYNAKFRESYAKTFDNYNVEVEIRPLVIQDIEDYADVYRNTKKILEETSEPKAELYFLLLSGSYTMNICWILLGKTLFEGAHFLRNKGDKIISFDIPLDLVVDYIPKVLNDQDNTFHGFYDGIEGIDGKSEQIKKAIHVACKAALHDVTVLLVGESGTGKEKFAKLIHDKSPRKAGPFRAINCATLPETMLEDMLFGHVKGSFTNASRDKPGLLETLDGGTLFLDEIGECPPEIQAKLLRVLQPPSDKPLTYREFSRFGRDEETKHSDVRIIAATNRDLRAMSRKEMGEHGSFRSDLLFRLSAIVINLPPLRERKEDIMLLADELLKDTNEKFSKTPGYEAKHFSPKTIIIIQNYDWPGNVRELSNAILRGASMADGKIIQPEDLGIPDTIEDGDDGSALLPENSQKDIDINAHLKNELRKWVEKAIDCTDTKKAAADWLHLKSPQALDSKLKTLGMEYKPKKK